MYWQDEMPSPHQSDGAHSASACSQLARVATGEQGHSCRNGPECMPCAIPLPGGRQCSWSRAVERLLCSFGTHGSDSAAPGAVLALPPRIRPPYSRLLSEAMLIATIAQTSSAAPAAEFPGSSTTDWPCPLKSTPCCAFYRITTASPSFRPAQAAPSRRILQTGFEALKDER
ncbi:uncharacterized protein BDZ99DRAFT_139797 [Mytilinidion resinicola]|uniref:Uncharacterized protein n=1 Tax=Mytilinidion resinicola TaxID=574789 RepID=A0A6A6Z708_9PEZI|nr:uncharacterized protein BDZ99DRAFT_139797 [Mytilinidion resinicola]KAF2816598.1 hypothetical protein BDZ99DRAFT_139797 [Mytilinidion resinicola]